MQTKPAPQASQQQPKQQPKQTRRERDEWTLAKHTKPVRVEYFKGYRL